MATTLRIMWHKTGKVLPGHELLKGEAGKPVACVIVEANSRMEGSMHRYSDCIYSSGFETRLGEAYR